MSTVFRAENALLRLQLIVLRRHAKKQRLPWREQLSLLSR